VSNLKAEVQALNERNAELSRRLDRLDEGNALIAAGGAGSTPNRDLPTLTVVKLKPRIEPAPRIEVTVPVIEPSKEAVEELITAAPEPRETRLTSSRRASSSSTSELEFDAGLTALKTGNVSGGVSRLQRFASEYPKSPKADDALYFSGIGLMGLGDYETAAASFEQVLANYPAGNVVQDSMLKLAECRMRLNKVSDARKVYTQLVTRFPGTPAAAQAEQRLGSLTR
jgi:tol-pal system protein YbgF